MTLGNMRELGAHHLIGFCHGDARRHQALIDVLDCPGLRQCSGKRVDVRSN
jgi:hypothetical protein